MRDQIYEIMMLYGVSVLASAILTTLFIFVACFCSL